jgi:hypothetical protein
MPIRTGNSSARCDRSVDSRARRGERGSHAVTGVAEQKTLVHIQAGVVLAEHVVGTQHQLVADLAEGTRRMTLGQLVAVDTARLTVGHRIDGLGALRPGVLRGLDAVIEERVAHQAAEGPGLSQQIAAQCPIGTGGRSMGISPLVTSLASSPTSGVGKSNSSMRSGVRVMMSLMGLTPFGGHRVRRLVPSD